ncbi:Retrotransposon protein [Nesidiocoris tenuis]|uniref:Retrotransposon protein n=2 Tax=Nesidiocoris tenuis TaxID=355587 RepID=A0ABN7B4P7_9HEMI|nr:Retrotransposon protein [Nesidiocoris tenuis]
MTEARSTSLQISLVSSLTCGTDTLENRFSSMKTLQSVVAFCQRYLNKLKVKRSVQQRLDLQTRCRLLVRDKFTSFDWKEQVQPLSVEELSGALSTLVLRAQAQSLSAEIADAQASRPQLRITRTLGLFVDQKGVLRVGGRLRNAHLSPTEKHPALLPSVHVLTKLLIESSHKALFHAGPLATLHHLRSQFWIVNGKNVVRRQLQNCVRCYTIRPKPFSPQMGHLPLARTQIDYPFATTGVDYAGPFPVSIAGLKKNRTLDCYLAIFVCFAVKAVHIEVVTDLSTPGFLQAFERFVSRRGPPHTVWSDNGRNFLGASNEMKRVQALLQDSTLRSSVSNGAAALGTTWKFIPPSAPFFGGLWEAAVKQAKRLLKNCLRNQIPTLETFTTICAQVEAVLNSRPLTAMSSSPDDLSVLTPAHFLIFRPMMLPASDPQLNAGRSLKDRHKFTKHVIDTFWQRWKKEYLLELQSRSKWEINEGRPARVGDIVLVINHNAPPLSWTMGRIVKIYPGSDGVTRVADLRTSSGTMSRPVRKLCPLPEDVCGASASTAGEDVSTT